MRIEQSALSEACADLGVRLLVLFGSHAPGGLPPGPESDVDVGVVFRSGVPRREHFEVYERFAPAFPDAALDLVLLGDADPLFRWEVMERAVLLYGDDLDFLDYRAFAYRDFVDSEDLRRLERVLFDRKMKRISRYLRAAS